VAYPDVTDREEQLWLWEQELEQVRLTTYAADLLEQVAVPH
jgi:hypothetical protein